MIVSLTGPPTPMGRPKPPSQPQGGLKGIPHLMSYHLPRNQPLPQAMDPGSTNKPTPYLGQGTVAAVILAFWGYAHRWAESPPEDIAPSRMLKPHLLTSLTWKDRWVGARRTMASGGRRLEKRPGAAGQGGGGLCCCCYCQE